MSDQRGKIVPLEQADFSRPPPPFVSGYGPPVFVIVNSAQTNNSQFMPGWSDSMRGMNSNPMHPNTMNGSDYSINAMCPNPLSAMHQNSLNYMVNPMHAIMNNTMNHSRQPQRFPGFVPINTLAALPPATADNPITPRVVEMHEDEPEQAEAGQEPRLAIGWKNDNPEIAGEDPQPLRRSMRRAAAQAKGAKSDAIASASSKSHSAVSKRGREDSTDEEDEVPTCHTKVNQAKGAKSCAVASASSKSRSAVSKRGREDSTDEEDEVPTCHSKVNQAKGAKSCAVASASSKSRSVVSKRGREDTTDEEDEVPTRHSKAKAKGAKSCAVVSTSSKSHSAVSKRGREDTTDEEDEVPTTHKRKPTAVALSVENNDNNSDSEQDYLGRWLDGEDSDFEERKPKVSTANQKKKVQRVENRSKGRKQQPLSDSDDDFEAEARHKSLSLKGKASAPKGNKASQRKATQQRPEPKFTGARQESQNSSVDDPEEVIIISDSESVSGVPAAELFPEEEGMLDNVNNLPNFEVPDNSMVDGYCSVCLEDFVEGSTYLGIMHNCHCHRFCYVCALGVFYSVDNPTCPRCREPIVKVSSQAFSIDYLRMDSF